jgi:hypothetical protein
LQQLLALKCRQIAPTVHSMWLLDILPNYSLAFTIDHDPVPLLQDGSIDLTAITNIQLEAFIPF